MIVMRLILGLALVVLAAATGCGGASAPPASVAAPGDLTAAPAGEQEDESIADLSEHHRHHHHGGFAMFIAMSLDSLNTTPEQHDALAKIQSDMHAEMAPAHDAERSVLPLLSYGVASGRVDRERLDAALAQLSTASAGVHDAVAHSLDALHAVLTPPQRAALVDKVEAHFEVWHQVNTADEAAGKDHRGGHLAQLESALALSPDQVEKIRASLASTSQGAPPYDRAEADAHLKAFAEAFASDSFDAKTMTTGGLVNAHMATWGLVRTARLYEAAAPILTDEQRTKAAAALRRHANYKRTDAE